MRSKLDQFLAYGFGEVSDDGDWTWRKDSIWVRVVAGRFLEVTRNGSREAWRIPLGSVREAMAEVERIRKASER